MRVRRVEAIEFGPLSGASLDLGPRMNVVYGPNEAGKSSWHAAIYAGICGRRRTRGARTKAERQFAERHRPWNGDGWAVRIVLELDDGREIEMHQDLDEPSNSRVFELGTARDVTEEFVVEGAPDASSRLGLSRQTLLSTATVRQTEIRRVQEEAAALQSQLQAATTAAGADRTAQAAIERIGSFLAENVGLRRANSTKPLQKAVEGLHRSRQALLEVEAARAAYQSLREERDAAEVESERRGRELAAAVYTEKRLRLDGLRQRLEEAERLQVSLPAGDPPDLESLQLESRQLREVITRFEERPPEPGIPEGVSATELERQLETLPEPPTGDREPDPVVETAYAGWRAAREAVEAHEDYRPEVAPDVAEAEADSAELRRLAAALEMPSASREGEITAALESLYASARTPIWKIGLRVTGAFMMLVGAALAGLGLAEPAVSISVAVLGAVGLAIGFLPSRERHALERRIRGLEAELAVEEVERRRVGQERRRAEAKLAELGLPADPEALRQSARRREDGEAAVKAGEAWEAKRQTLERGRDLKAGELTDLLEGRTTSPAADASDLEAQYASYIGECRDRARLAAEAGRRSQLEEQLRTRRALESNIAQAVQRRREAEGAVFEAARRHEIDTDDVDEAVESLRRLAATLTEDLDRWGRAREARGKLAGVLAAESVDDLEAAIGALEAELARHPGGLELVDLGEDPAAALETIRESHDEVRRRLDRLNGQIENEEKDLVSIAEAQEAVERAAEELARVERLESTLETTLGFLDAARDSVQRDIAPHLHGVLEANLAAVTGGRYTEARVDPASLEVRVRTADGEWRAADRLSHGTMEQIYLLLRIALVRHMCGAGEPSPIFLDDPTVQSDAGRTEAVLAALERVSETHQIVLFSQEEEVRRWAERRRESGAVRFIELKPAAPTAS